MQEYRYLYRFQPDGLRAPKQLLDILLNAHRGSGRSVAIHYTSLLVNQELGEVPLDAVSEKATLAGFQKLVEGRSIVTIHINLVKNGVFSLEACAGKLDNLLVGTRLLATKLVAWESQDFKALVLVLLIDLGQLGVVGVR
jgi:hypothetical protein